MTGWTLFLTTVGVFALTAQLFRLIDFIERPARGLSLHGLPLPAAVRRLGRRGRLARRLGLPPGFPDDSDSEECHGHS